METSARRWKLPMHDAPIQRSSGPAAHAVRSEAPIVFATISDPREFAALGPEWSALFAASGQPQQVFQTFPWLASWAPLYVDRSTRLAIVTGRIDGRLVLVWPLVVHSRFGLRIVSGMGEPLSQYSDALIASGLDPAAAEGAFDHILQMRADVVALRRVRDDATCARLLRRRLGTPANRQAAPFVDLFDVRDSAAFEQGFPGKLRQSRRRRRRRLEERGAVSVSHHGPGPEAADLVAKALAFKREWARQAGVLAPALRDPRFEAFFLAAARSLDDTGLRVSALRCGDEVLGAELSILCKGRLFGHVLAPHPGYPQLGLGGILAETTILNALEQGCTAVDLLAPADDYKLEWTAATVGVGDYIVPLSLGGRLYSRVWLRFGRDAVKAAVHRLRPGLATLTKRLGTRRAD